VSVNSRVTSLVVLIIRRSSDSLQISPSHLYTDFTGSMFTQAPRCFLIISFAMVSAESCGAVQSTTITSGLPLSVMVEG